MKSLQKIGIVSLAFLILIGIGVVIWGALTKWKFIPSSKNWKCSSGKCTQADDGSYKSLDACKNKCEPPPSCPGEPDNSPEEGWPEGCPCKYSYECTSGGCTNGKCGKAPPPPSGKDCQDNGCEDGLVCCSCPCAEGDTIIGSFGCNCKNGKSLPADQQSDCCGGPEGNIGWCRKGKSSDVSDYQCTKTGPGGVPTPSDQYYQFYKHPGGSSHRCTKNCGGGNCDNPIAPEGVTGCH